MLHAVILFNLAVPKEFLELLATWKYSSLDPKSLAFIPLLRSPPSWAINGSIGSKVVFCNQSVMHNLQSHRESNHLSPNWKPCTACFPPNSETPGDPSADGRVAALRQDWTSLRALRLRPRVVRVVRVGRFFWRERNHENQWRISLSSFPAGGVWIENYSIYWCNAYHILPTGYCINYCIYQQLRSKDFLCSLLNHARFVYHTTRFMIWGVYSARPGRSEQVEDPRYQKHWKASVPSVPSVLSILRNPRDRTSDSGLLWASLRICPKVKLRSFTRHSWIFHRGMNRFHRFCRFPLEASLGLRAS